MADPQQQVTPQAAPAQQQQTDPAESILSAAQGLDNNARADAWDAFHQSKDETELVTKLKDVKIPDEVKADLWDAKHGMSKAPDQSQTSQTPAAAPSMMDKVKDVISKSGADLGIPALGVLTHPKEAAIAAGTVVPGAFAAEAGAGAVTSGIVRALGAGGATVAGQAATGEKPDAMEAGENALVAGLLPEVASSGKEGWASVQALLAKHPESQQLVKSALRFALTAGGTGVAALLHYLGSESKQSQTEKK